MSRKNGVDTLLTSRGKSLQIGQEIRFTLVKGPTYPLAPDPVNPRAPKEQFPLIAKFGESVVKPNLQQPPWNTARLYQQDVPKAMEDSDEEEDAASSRNQQPKKRWRPRKEVPKRQWILQEQVEFLESMMAKRQRKALPKDAISTRYEGMPEHNPSQYILLELQKPQDHHDDEDGDDEDNGVGERIQVTMLPTPNACISFSQPKAHKTLSMTEAEQAIQDQRGKMTRFMMHDKQRIGMMAGRPSASNSESRKRLFGKLTQKRSIPGADGLNNNDDGDDDDDDDIMGDLAFRNRKGGGRARKELLNTVGDAGIKVDVDGVLGGNNDAEFGKGQKFRGFKAEQEETNAAATKDEDGGAGAGESTKANDGLAMADDFYQRDVQAEYEELDIDPEELFDDDDVDVGEKEVVVEGGGFADDDDDDDLDEDNLEDRPSGAEGLASLAGFRLMLAKARGEITPEQVAESQEAARRKEEERRALEARIFKDDDTPDHLVEILDASEKDRRNKPDPAPGRPVAPDINAPVEDPKITVSTVVQVDENGQRIITLQSVRREIWLHRGRIQMKTLMKIYNINKKTTAERKKDFQEVVKELCIVEKDPIDGNMFVLKQHYSNMP